MFAKLQIILIDPTDSFYIFWLLLLSKPSQWKCHWAWWQLMREEEEGKSAEWVKRMKWRQEIEGEKKKKTRRVNVRGESQSAVKLNRQLWNYQQQWQQMMIVGNVCVYVREGGQLCITPPPLATFRSLSTPYGGPDGTQPFICSLR